MLQNDQDDFVELQNGCMCCTISEELFTSLAQLVSMNLLRAPDSPFDHIVIEASGISEPRAVRDNFQDAEAYEMPLLDKVQLDTLVTVVDAAAFLDAYESRQSIAERPDLGEIVQEPDLNPMPLTISLYGVPPCTALP